MQLHGDIFLTFPFLIYLKKFSQQRCERSGTFNEDDLHYLTPFKAMYKRYPLSFVKSICSLTAVCYSRINKFKLLANYRHRLVEAES